MSDPSIPQNPAADGTQPENPAQPNPQQPDFTAPVQPQAPVTPQYGAPQQPGYAAPQQPIYTPPQQPAYGGTPQYGTPQQPAYGGYPAQPAYGYGPAPIGVIPGPGEPFDGATDPEDLSRPLYGATFGQAIKRFFKGYAKFNGRASRSEYWWAALFTFLVTLIPTFVMIAGMIGLIGSLAAYESNYYGYDYVSPEPSVGAVALFIVGLALTMIVSLALLVPSYAIGWRRMHDANFAGPMYLISFASVIPYVGWLGTVAVLVLTVMPPKVEGRRFDTAL